MHQQLEYLSRFRQIAERALDIVNSDGAIARLGWQER